MKKDNSSTAINWFIGASIAYFAGTAIAGAIKRKREGTNGIGGYIVTPTGNHQTTIREAWKEAKHDSDRWVIFKDIEEPKDTQVWIIDEYDRSERKYLLYNFADTSKWKYCKGDAKCFTGFTF